MAKPGEKYVGSSWYFRFRFRWQRSIERLTDAEAGRLVKAMLYYSMTGGVADLPGKESVLMTALLDDLDEDREYAARISRTNSRNVSSRYAKDGTAAPEGYDRIRPYTTVTEYGTGNKNPPVVPPKGGRRTGRRRRKEEESRYTEEDFRAMEAREIDLGAVELGEDPEKEEP